MRVAHNMLFDSYISQLNQSTSRLQELSEQAASQKKVNRPSDNPVGTARILNYRDSISAIQQFQDNISQGKSRLGLADDTLQQTQDMLGRSKELAVQAANSSLNREDREAIAQELQQIFDQVLSQANTKYEGQSIFAGHKVQEQAYTRGLAVSSNKTEETSQGQEMDQVVPYVKDVEGESRDPIRVEFLADADDDEAESAVIGEDEISYKYSTDGGQSFSAQTLEKDETELELGDVTLKMHKGFEVDFPDTEQSQEGTKLDLKPTAIYQGDTQNKPGAEVLNKTDILVEPKQGSFESEVQVKVTNDPEIGDGNEIEYQYSLDQGATWSETLYADNPNSLDPDTDPVSLHLPGGEVQLKDASEDGTGDLENLEFRLGGTQVQQMNTEELQTVAAGDFQDKVLVRVDNDPDVNLDSDEEIQYSYSTDQGRSWSEGNTAENPTAKGEYAELVIPGGKLKLTHTGAESELEQGDQFIVQPRQASKDTEISQGVKLQQNLLGPEVFGGHYKNPESMEPAFESEPERNLFMGLGKLISALKRDDQEGIQKGLGYINGGIDQVSRQQAKVGARLNRLESTEDVLSDLELSEKERKGSIEDVDFAELMSQMSQQQNIYQAVLKSSSMIMRMSLVDYI